MDTGLKLKKNLTRFTYEETAFQGWRLAISREGRTFVKYFPDKRFGSGEAALAAAEDLLNKILLSLDQSKVEHGKITRDALNEVEKYIR